MNIADIDPSEPTAWQRKARPRLTACIALAALLIGAVVILTRFDVDVEEVLELEVQLFTAEPETVPEPAENEPEAVLPLEPPEELLRPLEAVVENPQVEQEPVAQGDWHAQIDDVVRATVAEQLNRASVNPAFDAKRRRAAVKFAPSGAPQKKPIWENVETDQMGRKILVSGDCHRVVDDPSAANNDIFRTFQQYIVYCTKQKSGRQEQPWVEEIRDRHNYLAQQG